jgi:predicted aldo/keto reductase-like oxidoreductase
VRDTITPFYFDNVPLPGFATEEGTDAYYKRSQYEDLNLEVHPDNFKTPFESNIKISSIGYGTYIGDPDDYTDYLMYDSIKTSVLSGGINHIDTAPNYRYMKSERTVGKIVTTLDNKYGIRRNQLFLSTKGGYIPEDAEKMLSKRDIMKMMVEELKVPEA